MPGWIQSMDGVNQPKGFFTTALFAGGQKPPSRWEPKATTVSQGEQGQTGRV